MATVAERVRDFRAQQRISQEELGKRLGVSGRVVWTWEANRTPIPADDLPRIAKALGVDVAALFREPTDAASYRAQLDEATERFRQILELRPERIEINVYVAGKPQERGTDVTPAEPFVPTPADRDTRDLLKVWATLTDQQRQEWLQLAEAIREETGKE